MSRNLCKTHCPVCRRSFEPVVADLAEPDGPLLMTEDEYLKRIGQENSPYRNNMGYGWTGEGPGVEVRFAKLSCRHCNRLFAGWYRKQSDGLWRLFDACYFYGFDDEPDERDEAEAKENEVKEPERRTSPLPWRAVQDGGWWGILDADGEEVASELSRGDAEAIVEAMKTRPVPQ